MKRKRAMTSAHASQVKRAGHRNEHDFADIIGGRVHRGSHTDKKDVIDAQDRSHSVKAGTWWQIFLYGRERLRNNTIFQGLGNIAPIMIKCLDAFPKHRAAYMSNKQKYKQALQLPMRQLLSELQIPKFFRAFLEKSLFDAGNAEYLSIFPGPAHTQIEKKTFYIFYKDEVINVLIKDIVLRNSKARNSKQTDDQKVTLFSKMFRKNIGEIEVRTDSEQHYREMKFRLNGPMTFSLLKEAKGASQQTPHPQIYSYGVATRKFKLG